MGSPLETLALYITSLSKIYKHFTYTRKGHIKKKLREDSLDYLCFPMFIRWSNEHADLRYIGW